MTKTARELLEESLSHLIHPVAEYNGNVITGWMQDSELGSRHLPVDQTKILDPAAVVDPAEYASAQGYHRFQGVCAIGAIALASLGQNLGINTDKWSCWTIQADLDPQVALATLALVYVIAKQETSRRHHIKYTSDADILSDEWYKDLLADSFTAVTKWSPIHQQARAKMLVDVVTSYNDSDERTLSQVIDLFNSAIKYLIKAEEEVA